MQVSEQDGGPRSALVLGLGASGEAAAELLLAQGLAVCVVDRQATPDLDLRAGRLRARGATVVLAAEQRPAVHVDLAVVSPGVAADSPWLRAMVDAGTPLLSELELGGRHCRCPLLAVTGTNGKSTLTTLCAEALTLAGRRVASGGNLGVPLARLAPETGDRDWLAVEVSSFQLETVDQFRPRVGVLLNVQPNHLDRHGSMSVYFAMKCRLFRRMGPGDTAVVPAALAPEIQRRVAAQAAGPGPAWVTFGTDAEAGAAFTYRPGRVRAAAGDFEVPVAGTRFDNPVLGLAAAAAAAALRACGLTADTVAEAIRRNRPLPHRMMDVGAIGGVRFIDDSKATSLTAMAAGLNMVKEPVRLIAGGLLKEYELGVVQEVLAKRVRAVYGIGKAADRMVSAWQHVVPCRHCGTLEAAVRAAWADAQPGEAVLLSPGCASFDQFRNFEERGARFAAIVEQIRQEEGHEESVVV